MKKFYTLLLLTIFLPILGHAQSASDVNINISPTIPEPGERVVLTLESFSVNLTDSNIRWLAKSQVIKEGAGIRSISFVAPNDDLSIVIQILTPEHTEIVKSLTLSASSVDLLWEAPDTYTPPFYRGKALPGPESLIKFVGIPSAVTQFGQTGTKNTDFIWQRDTNTVGEAGGRGRDSYTLLFDSLKNSELFNVSTNYAGKIASAETVIKPFDLNLSIYPLSSGGEPFITRALRSGDSVNRESSFFAAPYGAHPKYLDNTSIKFDWLIGGNSISPGSRPFLITLSPSGNNNQNLEIMYEGIKSLFDGFKRTYQIKI